MRYLHLNADQICQYIEDRGLHVTQCICDGSSPPFAAPPNVIQNMLARSEVLWGTSLPFYISVSRSFEAEARSLQEDVLRIEASPAADNFLIVAYQDGGLITVSGMILPFQVQAAPADWWRPWNGLLAASGLIKRLGFGLTRLLRQSLKPRI